MGLLLVGFFSLLYWYTLAPTVLWGDSAKLALYVKEMHFNADAVGNHMLHTLLGKLFSYLPFGDFAYRQNLMSAFFGVASILVFYGVLLELLKERTSAFLTSACLGVSHTFWLSSVVNESYSLFAFFFALGFLLWLKWEKNGHPLYLYLHFFLIGVGLLNNLLNSFTLLMTFILLMSSEKGRRWLFSGQGVLGTFCFLLALSPIGVLSFLQGSVSPRSYGWFLRPNGFFREAAFYPVYLFYQFPLLGFFLGCVGVGPMFRERRDLFWAVAATFLLDIFFSSLYMRQRRLFLYLPSYFCYAVWIGYGLKELVSWARQQRKALRMAIPLVLIGVPVILYLSLPSIADRYQMDMLHARKLAFRNNNLFYLNPAKRHEFGPREYGLSAMQTVKPNSLILGDFTPTMVLLYYQKIEGWRADVSIESRIDSYVRSPEKRNELYELISRELEKRAVYLADNEESYYGIEALKRRFELIPQGSLWEVRHRGA